MPSAGVGALRCLGDCRTGLGPGRVYAGPVAQWSEQGTHNPLVVGSIPTGPTAARRTEGALDRSPPRPGARGQCTQADPGRRAMLERQR